MLDDETSRASLGQMKTGKSAVAKKQVEDWRLAYPVIGHALFKSGGRDKFAEVFDALGCEVFRISSREYNVR